MTHSDNIRNFYIAEAEKLRQLITAHKAQRRAITDKIHDFQRVLMGMEDQIECLTEHEPERSQPVITPSQDQIDRAMADAAEQIDQDHAA
jgi:hypothetical protein